MRKRLGDRVSSATGTPKEKEKEKDWKSRTVNRDVLRWPIPADIVGPMMRVMALVLANAIGTGLLLAGAAGGCARSTGAGSPAQSPSAASAPATGAARLSSNTPPLTEEACRTCGGIWAVHGVASAPSCNCRTTDGGTRCRDGADCQGMCIASEEPEREMVETGPPVRGYFVGRCSDVITVYGCNRVIGRGAAAHGPSPLSEIPSSICVD